MPSDYWFVYILKSLSKKFLYIGSTNSLERRFIEHNSGFVQSTKAFRPLKIIAFIGVETEQQARDLERYLKTGSGKAILKKRIIQRYDESFSKRSSDSIGT